MAGRAGGVRGQLVIESIHLLARQVWQSYKAAFGRHRLTTWRSSPSRERSIGRVDTDRTAVAHSRQAVEKRFGYPTNLIARLLYGCGLRLSEPLKLPIKDVNFDQLRLCIRGAKGGSDRFVALPELAAFSVDMFSSET
jgi:integrase